MYREIFHSKTKRRLATTAITLFLVVAVLAGAPGVAGANGWGRVRQMDKFVNKIGNNVQSQKNLKFNDLYDAPWAAGSIAKMRGLGIVNGYGGNYFKPNEPVTQAEALTMMVRAFDMEDEARELAYKFGPAYSQAWSKGTNSFSMYGTTYPGVDKGTSWALGYILLAVDEGWVKLSECTPEKPATRAWISMVMVRALGHEEEALDQMDADLPFTDAAAVADEYVGYVAEAVSMGLFEGYEDGSFKPNKPVTRAEMATVLERFLRDELPNDIPYLAVGEVKSVSSNEFSILAFTGSTLTYSVSSDALFIMNGEPASLSDIEVGDIVEVLSNGQGVALLVTVTTKGDEDDKPLPTDGKVTGEIVGIATPPALTLEIEGQSNKTITLAGNCSIKVGSTTIDYSDLLLGDVVEVKIENSMAVKVTVQSRTIEDQTFTGTVTGVTVSSSGTTIEVDKGTSGTVTLRLASNVQVNYGGSRVTVSDIRIGDEVEAKVVGGVVVTLDIERHEGDPTTVIGIVQGITTSSSGIDLILKQGTSTKTLRLASDVEVTYGSTTLTVADIAINDEVEVTVEDSVGIAVEILAHGLFGDVGGTISSVTQTASETTIVLSSTGQPNVTIKVTDDTVIVYGDDDLERDDLRLGDVVRVDTTGTTTLTAVEIHITTRGS